MFFTEENYKKNCSILASLEKMTAHEIGGLKKLPQWFLVPSKTNSISHKIPVQGKNDKYCGGQATPAFFSTYEQVLKKLYKKDENGNRLYQGIGISLVRGQKITVFDFDNCVDEAGNIKQKVLEIINNLHSYAEFSNSGKGIHVFVLGEIKKDILPTEWEEITVEIYSGCTQNTFNAAIDSKNEYYKPTLHARWILITGKHILGTPEEFTENQKNIDFYYKKLTIEKKMQTEKRENAKKENTSYGLQELEKEIETLKSYPEHNRHTPCYESGLRIGSLIPEHLNKEYALTTLQEAAKKQYGYSDHNNQFATGIEKGMLSPRKTTVSSIEEEKKEFRKIDIPPISKILKEKYFNKEVFYDMNSGRWFLIKNNHVQRIDDKDYENKIVRDRIFFIIDEMKIKRPSIQFLNLLIIEFTNSCSVNFLPSSGIVNYENGVFDSNTFEFRPYRFEDNVTSVLDYKFNAGFFPEIATDLSKTVMSEFKKDEFQTNIPAILKFCRFIGNAQRKNTSEHKKMFIRCNNKYLLELANKICNVKECVPERILYEDLDAKNMRYIYSEYPILCLESLPDNLIRDKKQNWISRNYKLMTEHGIVTIRGGKHKNAVWKSKIIIACTFEDCIKEDENTIIIEAPHDFSFDVNTYSEEEISAFSLYCLLLSLETEETKKNNDSVLLFVQNCCAIGEDNRCFSSDLYELYSKYCIKNGFPAVSQNIFVDEINMKSGRAFKNKKKLRTIEGIKFTSFREEEKNTGAYAGILPTLGFSKNGFYDVAIVAAKKSALASSSLTNIRKNKNRMKYSSMVQTKIAITIDVEPLYDMDHTSRKMTKIAINEKTDSEGKVAITVGVEPSEGTKIDGPYLKNTSVNKKSAIKQPVEPSEGTKIDGPYLSKIRIITPKNGLKSPQNSVYDPLLDEKTDWIESLNEEIGVNNSMRKSS